MRYIDLHVHSNCSDGTFSPEELVVLGIKQELVAFSLTDHDTICGVEPAMKKAEEFDHKIQVIPGVELSCKYMVTPSQSVEIHMLGYQYDIHNKKLIDTLENISKERDARNQKMCKNLQDAGYPISYEALCERFGDTILTRAHFARLLLENGGVPSMDYAFHTCLSSDSPYFVNREYLTPKSAIDLIQESGGIPVLAHPLLYKLSVSQIRHMLDQLTSYGLCGIEALYSRNRGTDEAFVRKLADEYNLFITGGSDFHGSNKPDIELGRGTGDLRVPVMLLENLR
ncbi:MAG: PHP domain-containing protein [Clostridiales bacterium]|nr:PHP domain-containing protein [Clostridiales bacterium]